MASIRKAKKRLKNELKKAMAEQVHLENITYRWHGIILFEASAYKIDFYERELKKITGRKNE